LLEFKAEVRGESLEILLMQSNGQSATTEELTALECCDNPTVSGYFCQMITHTFQEYMTIFSQCGLRQAHLLEIQKLQLAVKNLDHKGVDFYVQNALELTHEHL